MEWKKIRHPAAAPKPEGSEAQETDWAHHIIIQHQLYAHPDAFTGVGEYPDYTQPKSQFNGLISPKMPSSFWMSW